MVKKIFFCVILVAFHGFSYAGSQVGPRGILSGFFSIQKYDLISGIVLLSLLYFGLYYLTKGITKYIDSAGKKHLWILFLMIISLGLFYALYGFYEPFFVSPSQVGGVDIAQGFYAHLLIIFFVTILTSVLYMHISGSLIGHDLKGFNLIKVILKILGLTFCLLVLLFFVQMLLNNLYRG